MAEFSNQHIKGARLGAEGASLGGRTGDTGEGLLLDLLGVGEDLLDLLEAADTK